MTPHPMPREVQIVFSLALLASLALLISALCSLIKFAARKFFDRAAQGVR
jgi:hypothetical protein